MSEDTKVTDDGEIISLTDLAGNTYASWSDIDFVKPFPWWMPFRQFLRRWLARWRRRRFVKALYAAGTGKFYIPQEEL